MSSTCLGQLVQAAATDTQLFRAGSATILALHAAEHTSGVQDRRAAAGLGASRRELQPQPLSGAPTASGLSDRPGERGGRKPVRHVEVLSPGPMKCKGRLCYSTRATGHSFS